MYLRKISVIILLFSQCSLAQNQTDMAMSVINSFEKIFGTVKGHRINHTKGFCFKATLIPHDKEIREYTTSKLFTEKNSVIGRLSHKGGNINAADDKPADYGMGLLIKTSNGAHKMSMNTLDFFPVATPQAFVELMLAKTKSAEAVKIFMQKNPDLQRYKAHYAKKKPSLIPYEGSQYNSLNTFFLVDDLGKKTAVRWSFVPSKAQEIVMRSSQDFFYENMKKNLLENEITWDMVVTIANDNDDINNSAIPWTSEHHKILAAKLKLHSISNKDNDECTDINFDPLVLSAGFEASQDSLLIARSVTYAIAASRRIVEKNKHQSKEQNNE